MKKSTINIVIAISILICSAFSGCIQESQKSKAVDYESYFSKQPYLKQIQTPSSLELPKSEIIVAVIDIGMDLSHPAYKGKLIKSDFRGNNVTYPEDEACLGHGTAVTSIIAAESKEMMGIAPNVKILPVCIGIPNPKGYEDIATTYYKMEPEELLKMAKDPEKLKRFKEFAKLRTEIILKNTADAIRYAVDQGAKVINMSFTTGEETRYIEDAVKYATSKSVVLVAGTGNNAKEEIDYPARFPEVIAVGGVNENNEWWYKEKKLEGIPMPVKQGSNFGKGIDVVAPCCNILHASPTQTSGANYQSKGCGTSLAVPLVSGLSAIILSKNPDLSPQEVRKLIVKGCDDLGPNGWDKKYGCGRPNVGRTLDLLQEIK